MSRSIFVVLTIAALTAVGSAWGAPSKSPGVVVVKVGENRTFTRTELRPGATVRCSHLGRTLSVTAPVGNEGGSGAVWPRAGKRRFHLNVDVKRGGGYTVVCGLGGVHW